jgi:hypothetical protein
MDAEKALDMAARMEGFVTTGGQPTIRKNDHSHPPALNAPMRSSPARAETIADSLGQAPFLKDDHRHPSAESAPRRLPAGPGETIAQSLDTSSPGPASHPEHEHISSAAEPPPATLKRQGTGRLLNEGEQQAFINRAVQGATNRDLARLFGLTPRQANSIRMALAKRMPQVALRAGTRLDA